MKLDVTATSRCAGDDPNPDPEMEDDRCGTPWGRPLPWVNLTGGPPRSVLESASWMEQAACVGTDPDAFFAVTKYARAAVRTCLGCPVAEACLASALVYGDTHGLRGGTVPRHRRRLAARLRAEDTLGHVVTDGLNEARWAAAARGLRPPTDREPTPAAWVGGVA